MTYRYPYWKYFIYLLVKSFWSKLEAIAFYIIGL